MSDPNFDPTADFLSREKAVLGNDAEFILGTTATDSIPSNSITEPLIPSSTSSPLSNVSLPHSPEQQATDKPDSSIPGSTPMPAPVTEIVSEATRRWQAEFNQLLIDRDQQESVKHQETIQKAQQEIDRFYEEYNLKREKKLQESKLKQTEKLQEETTGTFWERVCKYIDLDEPKKGLKDVSRFQQLLGQLKYTKEGVPGNVA